ncbi:MAG: type I methionyl aminopeptidase [Bacteroidetes bacterium GWF2_41_31]|nr:MAG: type I methionyl aminopeptidase [Bacteroidetes bacterium GWF2_41_31]OFZ09806.1 MAG: type I methionyl aminopeptidase [Bacteroidetes bacterium RIFOXYB12_FULL_41_6]
MIYFKTDEEVELLRQSSLLVGKTLAEVARMLRPGILTIDLDQVAETFIRDHGAVPGFKGYGGFPGSLCISINDEVVHGIPGKRVIKEGDIVSIDCGTILNGFYGDSAYTFGVGEILVEHAELLKRTKESLLLAVEQAVSGKRIGDIGSTVQNYVEGFGYSVVRELVGHGLGRHLHEKPEVPNYGRKGTGIKLKSGMCLAIEPMVNLGVKEISQDKDGWTIRTADGKPSAHFEHDVVVRDGKSDVLSTFEYIEEVIKKNMNLYG